MPLKMISRIFTTFILAFLMSNSFAQSPSGSNMLNAFRNFLNGTFYTQEGCENPIDNDAIIFIPQQDGTINAELRRTRNGISKISHRKKIKTISLVDESRQLIRYEADVTNLENGATFLLVNIVQFKGTSLRIIDSSEGSKKFITNGAFVRSGNLTKSYGKCPNSAKTIDGGNQTTVTNSDVVVEDRFFQIENNKKYISRIKIVKKYVKSQKTQIFINRVI